MVCSLNQISKIILLLCILGCTTEAAFAQHFYQSGNYIAQKQKSYLCLKGKLKERYQSGRFNWFIVENENKTYNISVVDTGIFHRFLVNDSIELKNCFKIARMNLKKKK
ncbi:hypothetical protein [Pedobacter yonginense]|nr:hypothetical protein [Pedobacter yonginense]